MLTFFLLFEGIDTSTFGKKINMKNRITIKSIVCNLFLIACISFTFQAGAQENVGIGTDNPHPSAKLDVFSFDQGVLVPRLKEAWRQGIQDPAQGLLVYDITHKAFFVYDGVWKKIMNEDQLPNHDHITDADNDTWIHTENNPDQDSIRIQVGGIDMGSINNKAFNFKSPGNSLFIGENSGMTDDGSENRNLFIGKNAGTNTISGWQNILIGSEAGKENTTGARNLFIGHDAGREMISADYNVVIGSGAGVEMTNGNDNVIIGDDAGKHIGSGDFNVFVGSLAGRNNANNNDNVMVGTQAGYQNALGGRNVFVGSSAGRTNNGADNIFIGNHAGEWEEGNERLYIDNTSTDQPLIFGRFDTDELTVNGALKIKNEYTFPIVDGANGEVLGTNGAGVVEWIPNGGTKTLITDLDLDTKIQVEELPDEDIIRFDVEGNEVMILDRNDFGMARLNLNPVFNAVLIGNGAGDVNEGASNVFIGKDAGKGNSFGFGNTFLGASAGFTNIDGTHNTYMGLLAGNANNGNENVMLGEGAGSEIFYGDQNVLIGTEAGQKGTLSSRNVKIGFHAGKHDHSDDKLYIENTGGAAPLIFGDFQEDYLRFNGKVGVYADPNAQLHVKSFTSNPAVRVEVNDLTKLLINENGGTTIGSEEPDRTPFDGLYVEGQVNFGGLVPAVGYRLSVDGEIICEDIRIEDSDDWPDYVFESDYDLMPLSQVDAFISKEGHLPNIPAAKIIEKEGFDAGEMMKRLLEKIEELTLHTIRQQKQIDEMRGVIVIDN